jgi:hypothetical protein
MPADKATAEEVREQSVVTQPLGRIPSSFSKRYPLCVHCLAGVYASATIVDHIIPIEVKLMCCSGPPVITSRYALPVMDGRQPQQTR